MTKEKFYNKCFFRRAIAIWIDAGIAALISDICLYFMGIPPEATVDDNLSFFFFMLIGISVALLRDIFGRSLGKLILGLHIVRVDNIEGKPPAWKLILRNITTPIWPIKALIMYKSKDHRRYMDRVLQIDVI